MVELRDLSVAETKDWTGTQNVETRQRPATVSDLVDALRESGEVRWWTPHQGLIKRHKGHLWVDEGPIVDGELSPVDRDGQWVLVVPLGEDA